MILCWARPALQEVMRQVAHMDSEPSEMSQLSPPSGWPFGRSLLALTPGPAQPHLLSPQVGNLGLLFMLLFFIYAALGVELFGKLGEWLPTQAWGGTGLDKVLA